MTTLFPFFELAYSLANLGDVSSVVGAGDYVVARGHGVLVRCDLEVLRVQRDRADLNQD
jgi:hypothetical protein